MALRNDEREDSVAHRPEIGESVEPNKEKKEPRVQGPPASSIHTRTNAIVWRKQRGRNMDQWSLRIGSKVSGENRPKSERTALIVEKKIAYLVPQIDDCAKHIFREDHQQADHLANLGTEGE